MNVLPSLFRHKVKIQEQSTEFDEFGQQSIAWKDIASVWAGAESISTTQTEQGGAVNFIATHKIYMRYTPLINHKNRIVMNGKNLRIISINNDQEINHSLILICQEVLTTE